MSDRVSSDHDSVQTHRASLETVGRTDRVEIVLPTAEFEPSEEADADDELEPGRGRGSGQGRNLGHGLDPDDVVELALDGDSHYAKIESTLDDELVVRRATDNRRQAREDDGENRLAEWVDDADVRVGGSVHLDVVTPGHAYGVRTPGKDVVYRVTEPRAGTLADIAADLDGE